MKLKFIIPIRGDISEKSVDIENYLRPYLLPDTELVFEHLKFGVASVENELSGIFNGAQVITNVFEDNVSRCDGVFIDCFDDPGLYACREMGKLPVTGPYQAAVSTAMLLAERIGIITTDEAGILNEEKKARAAGIKDRIVSIRSLNLSVWDIRTHKEQVLEELIGLCESMVKEDRVSAICLGCTAMFYIIEELKEALGTKGLQVSMIEPILNGVIALENMIRQGHSNYIPGGVDFSTLYWIQKE